MGGLCLICWLQYMRTVGRGVGVEGRGGVDRGRMKGEASTSARKTRDTKTLYERERTKWKKRLLEITGDEKREQGRW